MKTSLNRGEMLTLAVHQAAAELLKEHGPDVPMTEICDAAAELMPPEIQMEDEGWDGAVEILTERLLKICDADT